jgi:dTDP-4-amino-4,6-dideoxygalactose transaminase
MRGKFLPFAQPAIGEEEIAAVVDTLRSDWITTGPKTQLFGRRFAEYIGCKNALPLNSCTAGLHTALVALGIGPGDEIITTPMTFTASVNVIEHVGARPVFVDVEPDTLNIDPGKVKTAVNNRTKAIIPVHFGGHPVELDLIHEIASRHDLYVVEDAAHALAAKYKHRMIGSASNPVAFSFYATKNLTTAEGGALTGEDAFLAKAGVISLHGMTRDAWKRYGNSGSWFYEISTPGFKYNMTDIQAAIGLAQLDKLPAFQKRRREIVQKYNQAFAGLGIFDLPVERKHVEHAWHLYVLRLKLEHFSIDRAKFIEEMGARNIGCSVHFIPMHIHPYYRDKYHFKPDDFPVAHREYQRLVSLPLHPRLSDDDVQDVIDAVLDIVKKFPH